MVLEHAGSVKGDFLGSWKGLRAEGIRMRTRSTVSTRGEFGVQDSETAEITFGPAQRNRMI
jgi:hypothetical protein